MPNRPAISSMSLGRAYANHSMEEKLMQAAAHGFEGIEVFFEDIDYIAKELSANGDLRSQFALQLEAAKIIRDVCDHYGLHVVCLQPFLCYGGLKDRNEHHKCIETLLEWFQLVQVLRTDLIQIPSNFLTPDRLIPDTDVLVDDMRQIADLGLGQSPPVRFAYENLAWGTYVDTWEGVWEIVSQVDRPNFGMCLDTFNIVGRVWADPASPTGRVSDGDIALRASMKRLAGTIDVNKVFYVQVVDAERLNAPLDRKHPFYVEGQPVRMSWSRNCRLFAFEHERGSYLPILEVARIIFDLGFEGWVSMELFSRSMASKDSKVPLEHARRASVAWEKLKTELKL
jgi:4-hydroxyphenylpyruvate dioxygenase